MCDCDVCNSVIGFDGDLDDNGQVTESQLVFDSCNERAKEFDLGLIVDDTIPF